MEEIINNGEQPINGSSQVARAKEDNKNIELGDSELLGSPYGKFKSADKLFEAYNNLQSEFTRKCQRIKELEEIDNSKETAENTSDCNLNEENINSINNEDSCNNSSLEPKLESDQWQKEVSNFLDNNPEAKKYAYEISEFLLENKDIANLKNALDISYAMVLSKKLKTEEELINDDNFINKTILNNKNLENKIISNYISKVSKQAVPPVISKNDGGYFQVTNNAPSSLEEAKKQAELLFNQN